MRKAFAGLVGSVHRSLRRLSPRARQTSLRERQRLEGLGRQLFAPLRTMTEEKRRGVCGVAPREHPARLVVFVRGEGPVPDFVPDSFGGLPVYVARDWPGRQEESPEVLASDLPRASEYSSNGLAAVDDEAGGRVQ